MLFRSSKGCVVVELLDSEDRELGHEIFWRFCQDFSQTQQLIKATPQSLLNNQFKGLQPHKQTTVVGSDWQW